MSTPTPAGSRRVRVQPRRKAEAPASKAGRSGAWAIGAIVVAIVLLSVAGLRDSRGESSVDAPTDTPVSSVVLSCPHFGNGDVSTSRTSIATTAVGAKGRGGTGKSAVTKLPGNEGLDALVASDPGAWSSDTIDSNKTGSVLLTSTGANAPGSVAFEAADAPERLGGGLAVSGCTGSAKDAWFIGAGSVADRKSTLLLTNLSRSPAVATVSLLGTGGAVESVGGDAIVVQPGAVRAVPVEDLAAGEAELGLRVQTRRGALSASMADASTGDLQGSDWIPASRPVAKTQTITGLSPKARNRTLLVANPTDSTATVNLLVSGKDGVFTPRGFEQTEVRPGSIVSLDIPGSLGEEALALKLDSNEAVTATVRSVSSGSGPDVAYTAAGQALTSTAVVPTRIGTAIAAEDATLVLTGSRVDSAADATVTAHDSSGQALDKVEVAVPAGRTIVFDPTAKGELDASADQISYLTVDPGDVPIFAAAMFRQGAKMSTVPLIAAPSTTKSPAVSAGD